MPSRSRTFTGAIFHCRGGLLVDECEVSVSDRRAVGFYLLRRPVVTVIGKAFYGIDQSGKHPRKNRHNYDSSLAVWEIHPVMKLVQNGPWTGGGGTFWQFFRVQN